MHAVQLCVQMKNQPGPLHQVTGILKLEGVNILAINVCDSGNGAVLRMVVDDPELATNALASRGVTSSQEEVLAVELPDHPGGLHAVLDALGAAGISVRQLYRDQSQSGSHSNLILVVDQPEKARPALKQHWIRLFDEEVYER